MVMKYQSDEEIANLQGVDPVTGKPLSSAPGGSLIATGAPPVQNVKQAEPGGGGTGFTSITQYLEQNRPQASKLASQVGQFVTGKGEAAQSALNEAQTKFEDISKPTELNQGLLTQAIEKPAEVVQNQDLLDAFNAMKSAEYTGPSSFEEGDYFTDLYGKMESAKTAGEGTKSAQGQKNLLTEMAKSPNVTPGMTSLNQLLLANPEARDKLTAAREGLSGLDERLATASEAAKARAEASKTTTESTSKAVSDALKNAYSTFESGISQRELDAEAEAKAKLQAYQNMFSTSTLPTSVPSGVNIKPGADMTLGGVNPQYLGTTSADLQKMFELNNALKNAPTTPYYKGGNYYTDLTPFYSSLNPEAQITRENVATADEYARWNALNQLSGGPDLYGGQYGFLPETYGGGYNPDMVDFDYTGAQAAMMANYRKIYTDMKEAYRLAQSGKNVEIGVSPETLAAQFPIDAWGNIDMSKSKW